MDDLTNIFIDQWNMLGLKEDLVALNQNNGSKGT
jgi:hypothetical protein